MAEPTLADVLMMLRGPQLGGVAPPEPLQVDVSPGLQGFAGTDRLGAGLVAAAKRLPMTEAEINPNAKVSLGNVFRGTEAGGGVRSSTVGDLGPGTYVSPSQEIAASYGGGPTASVKGGTRTVHNLQIGDLYPDEVAYVFGGKKVGEPVRIVSGNGIPLYEGEWSAQNMEKALAPHDVKAVVGTPGSIGINQIAVRDPSILRPAEVTPASVLTAAASAPQAPAIVSRANPTPADIQAIYARAAELKDSPWPTTATPVFKTTPEAYAETEKIVPQVSIRDRLPAPLPGEPLPLGGRAQPVVHEAPTIGARIAERLDPLVREGSPLLDFYGTAPVIRGLENTAGLSPAEALTFMRDWAGQGAATSPRTATPPNLRNSSYLLYNRAAGTPVTPEVYAAEGNRPGFRMMGMHVNLADQFARGVENPLTNPKPTTFRENWSGNLRDITGDTHNIRGTLYELDQILPGGLPPQWFNKPTDYEAYRAGGGFPAEKALNVGAINDSLQSMARNKIKSQVEYGAMTAPWYHAAEQLGIAPARAQSGGWFSYGPLTGLKSPPKTIPELLNDQIGETARVLGVPPQKALEWWGQRRIPLSVAESANAPA